MTAGLRARTVTANDLEFGVLDVGSGPLALCLHGFLDSAHTWRHLLPALAAAGFHAVAPFTRGYAPTAVPADGCYRLGALVADAVALHEALGGDDRAVLIGHDWGAETAYGAAAFAPARWRRVVTLAMPSLALDTRLYADYGQLKRFFYLFLMRTPLAEAALAADDLAFLDRLWEEWSPGYDAREDLHNAKRCLREDANYLHGDRDGCIDVALVGDAARHLAPGSRMDVVEGAGHFLHVEQPAEANERILAWVTG